MRKHFAEFFRPSEDELKALWADAVFAFDTNVLLNLYRMSSGTSAEMRQILTNLADRLFLPNQVGIEFFRHLEGEIAKQVNQFDAARQRLKKIPTDFSNAFPRHPCIPIAEITKTLEACVAELITKVDQSQEDNSINFLFGSDPILSQLDNLFSESSEGPNTEEEAKVVSECVNQRIRDNVAPCFTSGAKKTQPDNHPHLGDGKVWFQIVNYAQKIKKPIIFVTADTGENWWRMAKLGNEDRAVGPHTALIRDIRLAADQMFWMYTQDQFLSLVEQYLGESVQTKTIDEIKQLQNEESAPLETTTDDDLKSNYHEPLKDTVDSIIDNEIVRAEKDVYLSKDFHAQFSDKTEAKSIVNEGGDEE